MGKGPRTPLAGHPRLPGRHEQCPLCRIPSAQEAKHLVKKPIGTSHSRNVLAGLDQTVVGDEDVRERPGGETWGGLGQMVPHPPVPRPSPASQPWVTLYQP